MIHHRSLPGVLAKLLNEAGQMRTHTLIIAAASEKNRLGDRSRIS
jgi:hypothetical protein